MDDLQSIKDFIRWGASYFMSHKIGCISPYNEAYSLIRYALSLKAIPDRLLDAKLNRGEIMEIRKLFDKRAIKKIPIPYIINESVFAGKSFYVDERVLIPRSPIQIYFTDKVDGIPFLNYKLKDQEPKRILDLCTGSGCIGIIAALHFPKAIVDLADISYDALKVAEINIKKYNLNNRVNLIQSDLFDNIKEKYDLIFCNPPYVSDEEIIGLKSKYEISAYEPELALKGGIDGLYIVTKILNEVGYYLQEDGRLILEVAQNKNPLYPKFPYIEWHKRKDCPTIFVIKQKEVIQNGKHK